MITENKKKYQQFQSEKALVKDQFQVKSPLPAKRLVLNDDKSVYDNDIKERCNLAQIPLAFEHFKPKFDVNFYTDFSTVAPFKTIFNHVAAKAQII